MPARINYLAAARATDDDLDFIADQIHEVDDYDDAYRIAHALVEPVWGRRMRRAELLPRAVEQALQRVYMDSAQAA